MKSCILLALLLILFGTLVLAEHPIGSVTAFAGETVPAGYLECDGSIVARTSYPKLFETIGLLYTKGHNTTHFSIPDYRGIHLCCFPFISDHLFVRPLSSWCGWRTRTRHLCYTPTTSWRWRSWRFSWNNAVHTIGSLCTRLSGVFIPLLLKD